MKEGFPASAFAAAIGTALREVRGPATGQTLFTTVLRNWLADLKEKAHPSDRVSVTVSLGDEQHNMVGVYHASDLPARRAKKTKKSDKSSKGTKASK